MEHMLQRILDKLEEMGTELEEVKANMATKQELEEIKANMATKQELEEIKAKLPIIHLPQQWQHTQDEMAFASVVFLFFQSGRSLYSSIAPSRQCVPSLFYIAHAKSYSPFSLFFNISRTRASNERTVLSRFFNKWAISFV